MTLRKFLIGFVVVLALQAGLFAWNYRDLLYLRQPSSAIVTDGAATFASQAGEALSRKHLTRQHLDTIADTARTLGQPAYEIAALERRLQQDPHDAGIRVRLADVYRRTGQLDRAEALYLEVLQRQEQTR
jgi:thioredoxin-like negative regulator of GroEL